MASHRGTFAMITLLVAAGCGRSGPPDGVGAPGDDDDVATSATPTPSATATPGVPVPATSDNVALNEVFGIISTGGLGACDDECDANRSGATSATGDEFVEIVNVSSGPVTLDGVALWEADNGTPRYVFGTNAVLAASQALVLFASLEGTTPNGADFGGALVLEVIGAPGLDFSNGGDTVELRRNAVVLDSMNWGGLATDNRSRVLSPELIGNWGAHPQVDDEDDQTRNSSPGWHTNFTAF